MIYVYTFLLKSEMESYVWFGKHMLLILLCTKKAHGEGVNHK